MQLVLIHHHLNRGGVTQVMRNHLMALNALEKQDRPDRVLVLFDGQQEGWEGFDPGELDVRMVVVPSLAYDTKEAVHEPERLAASLESVLRKESLDPEQSILHVHNHSLGKSVSLPGALSGLAASGWKLLLQVHDFAEDNRPANYRRLADRISTDPDRLGKVLYPQAENIHYAALTDRDTAVLSLAGIDRARLHTLPNPAAPIEGLPDRNQARQSITSALGMSESDKLIVYPVRGIRRKNLGEMLLISALAPAGVVFAVTLAPKNPQELTSFDRWRRLSEELGLPCRFDTGGKHGLGFGDTLAAADRILTTSVAEGFGMVFLEAWLAGRSLIGRDLPGVTEEFRGAGMRLDGLWSSLPVPLELVGENRVRSSLEELYQGSCEQYGVNPLSTSKRDAAIESLTSNGEVDFARLTPGQQSEVIKSLAADQSASRSHRERLGLEDLIGGEPDARRIASNAVVVGEQYSPAAIGRRLRGVYEELLRSGNGPATIASGGRRVLEHYLSPQRLHAVRLEP